VTIVVMTGGTSGIGRLAAQRLVREPGLRLLVGARGDDVPAGEKVALDLRELASVRDFAAEIERRLGDAPIDALVLNAGGSFANADTRTPDGFETTFAVNHLAHYLLARLLLPRIAHGGRLILTSSGTHDPAERTLLPVPRHATAELLAHPDRDPDREATPSAAGGHAYAASKLCNVLTARRLAGDAHVAARRIVPIAWTPGPTPGTGLVRERSLAVRLAWRLLGTPLRHLVPKLSSRDAAATALVDLTLGRASPPPGSIYAALRRGTLTWCEPSVLARRDDLMRALWEDSARLVGLLK
jgi:NAD(P)-dependent dehydrogenase (short-subunit alcohol dehydrogenase family)